MKKTILMLDGIVFLFVLLFAYASFSKMIEYDEFVTQIGKSPLIMTYPKTLAILVPGVEILVSIILLIPRLQLYGLYCAFTLMLTFTLYIIFILTFSPYVPCSCGGILAKLGWTEHMIFNIFFIALAITGIVLFNKRESLSTEELQNNLTPATK